jgi:DNA mismatch repair ATPase MutS
MCLSHIELQRLNAEMLELDTKYSETQEKLFQELCSKVMSQAQEIVQTARVLARLDVSTSLGLLAADRVGESRAGSC